MGKYLHVLFQNIKKAKEMEEKRIKKKGRSMSK